MEKNYGKPYTDLTSFISAESLIKLDEYLQTVQSDNGTQIVDNTTENDDGDSNSEGSDALEIGLFSACSKRHGNAIELKNRDTSSWVLDDFVARSPLEDFKGCRGRRGDSQTWKWNTNSTILGEVTTFVETELLPTFFKSIGKTCIIINNANDEGVEHSDHEFPDLVSEFVWIRPPSSKKEFFVVDDVTGEKHILPKECHICFFDDHFRHNINPVNSDSQVSIRVDGLFNDKFRALLSQTNRFYVNDTMSEGTLREVFKSQINGPKWLKEAPGGKDSESFNVGDIVEAAFDCGNTWYAATIVKSEIRGLEWGGDGQIWYDVKYNEEDGGELEILEDYFVRKLAIVS